MIWLIIYFLMIVFFYCLFIASGEDHNTALLTACIWPVVLTIMLGALIVGMFIGLFKIITGGNK